MGVLGCPMGVGNCYFNPRMRLKSNHVIMVEMSTSGKMMDVVVAELRRGEDESANFQILFDRYYAQVKRFLRRKGLSAEDAEELTQDAFISVYKGIGGLNDSSQFEAWLFRIALNAFRNFIERGQAKKREGIRVDLGDGSSDEGGRRGGLDSIAGSGADPVEELINAERTAAIHAAITALPVQMRRCLQLRVAQELSNQEIAALMGISINTVKAHLQQARKLLAEKLRAELGET
jgi:RNA polymerase sigma-70 factor (ECF subfamily)